MTDQQKDYQVLARRYRPQTFKEVLGQEAIVTTLKNGIKHKRLAHAYLFCGSRGTGKTTLARVFAKALNCHNRSLDFEPCNACSSCKEIASTGSLDVLEIDGASHRGIDDVRQINDTVAYAPSGGKYKIYIIDEVHMLTKEAFNALLKTLEEPPEKVKFFFATTEPHKVPQTILSRCQRFNLNRIAVDKIISKLRFMANEQGVHAEDEALLLIAQRAEGGFRDAESLLDQILAFCDGAITAEAVAKVLGIVCKDIFFKLDQAGLKGDLAFAFEVGHQIFSEGKDLFHFVELLTEHFRTLLVLKIAGKDSPLVDLAPGDRAKYEPSIKIYTKEQCLTIIDFLIEAQSKIKFMPSVRIAIEALLLRILRIHQRIPVDYLVQRLSELEEAIQQEKLVSPEAKLSEANLPSQQPLSAPLIEDKAPSFKDLGIKVDTMPVPQEPPAAPAPTAPSTTPPTTPQPNPTPAPSPVQPVGEVVPQPEPAPLPPSTPAPFPAQEPLPPAQPAPEPGPSQQPELLPPSQPAPPTVPPPVQMIAVPLSEEEQREAKKKQSRYDTLLQFAAIELEGSLQKKSMRGY